MHNAGAHSTGTLLESARLRQWYCRIYNPTCALGRCTDLGFMVVERVGGSADLVMVKGAREREWGIRGERRIEERNLGEARGERTASDTRSEELARGERREEREG